MKKLRTVCLALLGIAFATALAAQTPAESDPTARAAAPVDQPEVVLVVGEQPGPGLWKVSRDDHVMWVLGTYGPLPKDMQ